MFEGGVREIKVPKPHTTEEKPVVEENNVDYEQFFYWMKEEYKV